MNKISTLTLIALLFAFTSQNALKSTKSGINLNISANLSAVYDKDYFKGKWRAENYSCKTNNIPESVEIIYTNNEVVATKVIGDDCVNSGQVTFRFSTQAEFKGSDKISCTLTLGSVFKPQSSSSKATLQIIDRDTFTINNQMVYYRGDEMEYEENYFLGYWLSNNYNCGNLKNIKEDIIIKAVEGNLVATKVNGDNCVNSGVDTFKFPKQNSWKVRKNNDDWGISCVITLGTESKPQSSTSNKCNIKIDHRNQFTITNWNTTFQRGRLPHPYPEEYFRGKWTGENYSCNEKINPENVTIEYENGVFVARKDDGDECVEKGEITFRGIVRKQYTVCDEVNIVPVVVTIGTTTKPQSSHVAADIRITDDNHFVIEPFGVRFHRNSDI